VRERTLLWDGCMNVRDLGGHATEDGEETRFGAIVRADSVRQLSDSGWQALVDYGVRTVIDLRFQSELEADPPRDLPVDVVHISLLGSGDAAEWEGIDAIADAAPDSASATRDVYLEFLERWRRRFGEAIAAVAEAPEGAVLVHCQGGKDRTGLVTALLLRLAGVPAAGIGADYSLSADNIRRALDARLEAGEDVEERIRHERISETPAEAMTGVIRGLEECYGSVRSYLLAAGTTEEQLDAAAARLRG
jgi:protein-tyrosine phosphatase